MSFLRVVSESGLAKTEMALMYGVSRQSIHGWANGNPPREGTLLARQAAVITQALVNAIDSRLLPMGEMDKEIRKARIRKMAQTLQALRPVPIK